MDLGYIWYVWYNEGRYDFGLGLAFWIGSLPFLSAQLGEASFMNNDGSLGLFSFFSFFLLRDKQASGTGVGIASSCIAQ